MTSELDRLCERRKVRATAEYSSKPLPEYWDSGSTAWRVRLTFERRSLTVDFYTGSAHTEEPGAADVLSCLISDARAGEQSFEDFCADFGYDADSRKAEKTWKACEAMGPKVRRLLGDAFDEFERAEH